MKSHNSTFAELKNKFNQINGLLFPGGDSDLNKTKLYYAGEYLLKLALEANQKGIYFPVFGHCMGFQLLAMIVSKDIDILENIEAEDISMPLNFTPKAYTSKLFHNVPQFIMNIFSNQPVTMNNHHFGVSIEKWNSNKNLFDFFNVLSLNDDIYSKIFVSTIESPNYPIYGIQWHPEKNGLYVKLFFNFYNFFQVSGLQILISIIPLMLF